MWIDRWCRVRFVCRWGHKVASLKMNAARMRTNPRYWSSGWFVEHSSKSLQIHVSLKICILLRCHCKGSYFEGEKEICEVNFSNSFHLRTIFFGWFWCWSVIKSQFLIAVWGLPQQKTLSKSFLLKTSMARVSGRTTQRSSWVITKWVTDIGTEHFVTKLRGILSLSIVTIRVPKESLFFLNTNQCLVLQYNIWNICRHYWITSNWNWLRRMDVWSLREWWWKNPVGKSRHADIMLTSTTFWILLQMLYSWLSSQHFWCFGDVRWVTFMSNYACLQFCHTGRHHFEFLKKCH